MYRFLLFLLAPLLAQAFEIAPWFPPVAEFELRSSYSYRHYPSVSHAINPSHYSSKDQFIDLNLEVSFWPNWNLQLETDFLKTRRLSWGTERLGGSLRYLMLDDVAGDPVSLAVSGQFFYVPTRSLTDVSTPYHAQGNLELGVAVGKEIDQEYDWIYRFYGYVGVGQANRGFPWLRPILAFLWNVKQKHHFKAFTEGYIGFGDQKDVNISRFSGYAKTQHRSVDAGVSYHYKFEIWGSLGIQYSYRVYAHSFPEKASTFTAEYRLPFSLL